MHKRDDDLDDQAEMEALQTIGELGMDGGDALLHPEASEDGGKGWAGGSRMMCCSFSFLIRSKCRVEY